MTRNGTVPEPRNGIDHGSYLHDFSDGSGQLRRKARKENSE